MQVRYFASLVGLAICMSVLPVSAQVQPPMARKLLDCPTNQLVPQYKNLKVWTKDHAGVNPVIPEMRTSTDPVAYLRKVHLGPTTETGEERNRLLAANFRVKLLYALQAFTPPGTPLDELREPPAEFLEQIRTTEFTRKKVPCGSTLVYYPSEADEDLVLPSGERLERARVWSTEPVVLGFCEDGVYTDAGECAVWVIESENIVLKSGPNAGNTQTARFYEVCGNLDFFLTPMQEETRVHAPAPPQTAKVSPESLTEGFKIPAVITAPPAPRSPEKERKFCPGKWKVLCIGLPIAAVALGWPRGGDLPPGVPGSPTPNNTPIKIGGS